MAGMDILFNDIMRDRASNTQQHRPIPDNSTRARQYNVNRSVVTCEQWLHGFVLEKKRDLSVQRSLLRIRLLENGLAKYLNSDVCFSMNRTEEKTSCFRTMGKKRTIIIEVIVVIAVIIVVVAIIVPVVLTRKSDSSGMDSFWKKVDKQRSKGHLSLGVLLHLFSLHVS